MNPNSNPNGKRPMAGEILDGLPETPNRTTTHHRRAHSDTSFRFDDDFLLFDPSDFDFTTGLDFPTHPPLPSSAATVAAAAAPMAVDSDDSSSSRPPPPRHLRSLSVDSEFFENLGFGDGGAGSGAVEVQERKMGHRRSGSVDGTPSSSFDDGVVKKAMGADKLAELALIDPKRAKRILANRQSAARSKERKTRYTSELERKVQTLQTEATTLSAQVTMLQRDTSGLTTENKELKFRLQAMEQQTKLRDALNEALREEVQRLKIATGQIQSVGGNPFSRGLPPQYSSQQQALHQFSSNQTQQAQSQQQNNMPQSASTNQNLSGQSQPNYFNFNHRV